MTARPTAFIDAHHHLWEPQTLEYGWLRDIGSPKPFGDPTPIQRDYTKEEFWAEASACGLVASVHVQADGALPDPVSESRWIAEQAAREPGLGQPGKWVGFVNLLRDDAQAVLEAHAAVPGFAGVRHIVARTVTAPALSFVPTELMQNQAWQENFGRLGTMGASFDLQLYPDQVDDAVALIGRHDTTQVIVDHCAGPYFLLEALSQQRHSCRRTFTGALGRGRLEAFAPAQRIDQDFGAGHVPPSLGRSELPGDLPDHP